MAPDPSVSMPNHHAAIAILLAAIATAVFVAAALALPAVIATTTYHVSDPCTQGFPQPGCGGTVVFNSSWHSQITVRWSSGGGSDVTGLCVSPDGSSFSSSGNPGAVGFPSSGGTSRCAFGPAEDYPATAPWAELTVTVKIVSPPL